MFFLLQFRNGINSFLTIFVLLYYLVIKLMVENLLKIIVTASILFFHDKYHFFVLFFTYF